MIQKRKKKTRITKDIIISQRNLDAGFFKMLGLQKTRKRKKRMNKRGNAGALFIGLVLIFFIAVTYMFMEQPYDALYDAVNVDDLAQDSQDSINKNRSLWKITPAFFIVMIFIWIALRTVRRQNSEEFV